MRPFFCMLVTVSLLLSGLEASADVVMDGVPHGDEASHQQEFGHSLDRHGGEESDTELDGEHCEHCCHAHTASMLGANYLPAALRIATEPAVARSADVKTFAQAPPTPPPNA